MTNGLTCTQCKRMIPYPDGYYFKPGLEGETELWCSLCFEQKWPTQEVDTQDATIQQLREENEKLKKKIYRLTCKNDTCCYKEQVEQLRGEIARKNMLIADLELETTVYRLYGNKDCTAMADEEIARRKAALSEGRE